MVALASALSISPIAVVAAAVGPAGAVTNAYICGMVVWSRRPELAEMMGDMDVRKAWMAR